MMEDTTKLLVIGIDAAEASLLDAWSETGYLPTLRSLREAGLCCRIENPPGIYTGAVWPSFFTAVSPGRHGRYFYRQIEVGSYDVPVFPGSAIGWEPFWSALSRAGRRSAIVDVPKAPLAEDFDGVQICDWGVHDSEGSMRSFPDSLGRDLVQRFGADPVGLCDRGRRNAASLAELRDALVERTRRKTELSLDLLGRGGWDLFLTVFSESHCAGHQFWHVHDASHPLHRRDVADALGNPLRDVYVALDAGLGRLMDAAGPGATVLVIASHGMGAHYDGTFLLDDILRRIDGVKELRRTAVVETARRLWQRTPARMRRPLEPIADRVYRSAGTSLPTGRRFFAVPTNDNCGGIRLNLAGREPDGRVRRGAEADAVCDELAAELLELVEVASGRPVVRDVLRSVDIFPGERTDQLPDLLVRWHRDTPIRGVVSPRVGKIARQYGGCRTGDHRAGGALYARRPGLPSGAPPNPSRSRTSHLPSLTCSEFRSATSTASRSRRSFARDHVAALLDHRPGLRRGTMARRGRRERAPTDAKRLGADRGRRWIDRLGIHRCNRSQQ